ncbi:hypothetical protein Brms1b_000624 [Colletotrichum noveboracense]|nr:hypothetical protein Brms1b_000624 [Colletotrichum noveboracense]
MPSTLTTAVLTALAAAGAVAALPQAQARQTQTHLLAETDYGSFQGAYSETYNISFWQKIPYASPPVGENRFRGPQPPQSIEGVYDSSQPVVFQLTSNANSVTFYGGGFVQGSAYFSIPPSAYPILNVSDASDMLFIYPNYRTNAFGLLPGKEIAADPKSDLNPGLLDQEAVLKWTQKYIAQFGGNPDDVTIWGQSAGGGSVLAQALGRGGKQKLFRKAMASSPFWPKTYRYDSTEAQALYDELARRTGCAGADSLACLKKAEVQTIRDASLAISTSHQYNTSSFTWSPVIDGEFLREPLSEATEKGSVNMDLAFALHNTHEGENFIPPGLQSEAGSGSPSFNSSEASFEKWLRGFLPGFGDCEIEAVKKLYPPAGQPADSKQWNQVNAVQKTDPARYQGYAGAFASFFQTGDPNALKLSPSTAAGVPSLKEIKEWTIVDAGFATAELDHLEKRCGFWRKTASKIPI